MAWLKSHLIDENGEVRLATPDEMERGGGYIFQPTLRFLDDFFFENVADVQTTQLLEPIILPKPTRDEHERALGSLMESRNGGNDENTVELSDDPASQWQIQKRRDFTRRVTG